MRNKIVIRMVLISCATALMLIFGASTKASPLAGTMSRLCSSNKTDEISLCIGYISGWVDALNGTQIALDSGKIVEITFADNITYDQISRVFTKYVVEHPEIENKLTTAVLIDALIKAKLLGFSPVTPKSETH